MYSKLAIRAERCRKAVETATDAISRAVMAQWAEFVTVIRGQLGL